MKTSTVPMMVAVLLFATGFGLGIAQAVEIRSERPVLAFDSMGAAEQGGSPGIDADNRPVLSFEDQEAYRIAKSPALELETASPIETGRLPSGSSEDSPTIEAGGVKFRLGDDAGP